MTLAGINELNFHLPFGIDFDLSSGLSGAVPSTKRKLSNMKNMYSDEQARAAMEAREDTLIYEFYELGAPEHSGDIAFGTSIVYPGKVGNEYFMTKGHFHEIRDTAEVYVCLGGHGYMLLENSEGDWDAVELVKGRAMYCAKGFAHRSINVGNEPLITFFAFRADAGHDYSTIETKGYRKLIVEQDSQVAIVNNPRWNREK